MNRTPEPTEEIDGAIAHEYVKFAKWRRATYAVVAYDIYERLGNSFKGKILEIGCAGGLLTHELHQLYPDCEITGTDVSEQMIEVARGEFGGAPHISFEHASAYSLPFAENTFDIVVCQGTLHHFFEPEKAVREMLRVVKPSGAIYIQDLRRDVPEARIEQKLNLMQDDYQKERELTSIRASLTKDEIDQMMQDVGVQNYEFKQAIFSQKNLAENKTAIESAEYNEINDMQDMEFIVWLEKST